MTKRIKGPALTTYQCPATGKVFDGQEILLPKILPRNDDDWQNQKPVHMGLKICPEVQEKIDSGFVCLVVTDQSKSDSIGEDTDFVSNDDLGGVYRTGEIYYMKIERAEVFFGNPDIGKNQVMFIDIELGEKLKECATKEGEDFEANS